MDLVPMRRDGEKPVTAVKCGFASTEEANLLSKRIWVELRLCAEVVATGVGRGLKRADCREAA